MARRAGSIGARAQVALAVVVAAGLVTVPPPAGGDVVAADDSTTYDSTTYVASLTARFTVDPVAHTMTAEPGAGLVEALDASGKVVGSVAVPVALSADPVPAPPGSGSGVCGVEVEGNVSVHPYPEQRVTFPTLSGHGLYMNYVYKTYQIDGVIDDTGVPKRRFVQ